jgi:hypothetical protein
MKVRTHDTKFGWPRKVSDAERIANREPDEGRRAHRQGYRQVLRVIRPDARRGSRG